MINKWSIVTCEVIRSPKNPVNLDTVNQDQMAIEGHIFMSPGSIAFKADGSFNASLYKYDTINYRNGNWRITTDNKKVIKIDSATGKVDTADIVMLTVDSLKIGSVDSKGNKVIRVYHSDK